MFKTKGLLVSTDIGITFVHESGKAETINHALIKSWDMYAV